MSDCLHCDINEVISEHVRRAAKSVDLAELATMIAQSLAEFIRSAPKHEQANLMADSLTALGATFLDTSEDADREQPHRAH